MVLSALSNGPLQLFLGLYRTPLNKFFQFSASSGLPSALLMFFAARLISFIPRDKEHVFRAVLTKSDNLLSM